MFRFQIQTPCEGHQYPILFGHAVEYHNSHSLAHTMHANCVSRAGTPYPYDSYDSDTMYPLSMAVNAAAAAAAAVLLLLLHKLEHKSFGNLLVCAAGTRKFSHDSNGE